MQEFRVALAIGDIPAEPADALADDFVNFSVQGIPYQLLETRPVLSAFVPLFSSE